MATPASQPALFIMNATYKPSEKKDSEKQAIVAIPEPTPHIPVPKETLPPVTKAEDRTVSSTNQPQPSTVSQPSAISSTSASSAATMSTDTKMKIMKEVGEEIIDEARLIELFNSNNPIIAYDGFEPSGQMHLPQAFLITRYVNKFISCGIKYKILLADVFAQLNGKLGGDMEKIQKVGKYFIEVWKACGMDTENVEFIFSSELYKDRADELVKLESEISHCLTIGQLNKCLEIMGRASVATNSEDTEDTQESTSPDSLHTTHNPGNTTNVELSTVRKKSAVGKPVTKSSSGFESIPLSSMLYTVRQIADIFLLEVDIAQLGMDQRKVNVAARDVAKTLGRTKPACVHHHMLPSLLYKRDPTKTPDAQRIEMKMSKSKKGSAIFATDSPREVKKKLRAATCVDGVVTDNPVLAFFEHLICPIYKKLDLERDKKYGGNASFKNYEEIKSAFSNGTLSSIDLKNMATKYINEMLVPVIDHFEETEYERNLLKDVKEFTNPTSEAGR